MNNIYLVFPIMTFFGALGGFFFKKGAENVDTSYLLYLISKYT